MGKIKYLFISFFSLLLVFLTVGAFPMVSSAKGSAYDIVGADVDHVNKIVMIRTDNYVLDDYDLTGYWISIEANNVTITNCNTGRITFVPGITGAVVTGNTISVQNDAGVSVNNSDTVVSDNVFLPGMTYCVVLESVSGCEVIGNDIAESMYAGIYASGSSACRILNNILNNVSVDEDKGVASIHLVNSTGIEVNENTINYSVHNGIVASYSSNLNICGNHINYNDGDSSILAEDCQNLNIDSNEIKESAHYGIMIVNDNGSVINKNQVINSAVKAAGTNHGDGILVEFSDKTQVTNNVVDGVRTALTDWGNGIIVGHDNTNVSLIGNEVKNIGNHGIQVSYASKVGILLQNNTVTKSGKDGISLSRNASADMIGNTVYDNIGHGIVYDGSDTKYNGQSGVSGLIENNECYSNTSCGIWVQQGNVTIKDNIVHDNGSEGIRTEFSQNAVIVNNTVTDNGKTGDKDYSGICLEYSSATISDNTVTKSEVNFSVRGIIIGGGSAATITRNKIHNYGLSAVYAAPGSTVDVTDNQASLSGTQSFRFAYDLKDSNDLRYAHTHLYVVEITPSSVLGQVYNNKSGNRSGAIVNGQVIEIHSSDVGVIEVSFEEQPSNENIAIFTVDKDTNNSICINVSTEYVLPEEVDQAELDREAQISCFVERFYTEILDREAEKEGLENWKLALMAGVRGGADVAYEFIKSPEYQQKMETDEKYVTRLYRAFFGRNPDKEGMESWLKDLENGEDRDFVLEGFLESKEFRELCEKYGIKRDSTRSFVRRFYKIILGRKDDQITPEELDLWQIALDSKSLTGSAMAREWINETEEFQLRPLDNEEYIKILYKVVFNRDADPDGLAHWTGKMDAGESRAEILEQIMAQPEFSDMCASYGIDP